MGVYGPGGHYLPHYDTLAGANPTAVTEAGLWVGNRQGVRILLQKILFMSDRTSRTGVVCLLICLKSS